MKPIGYYLNCDDATCADCYDADKDETFAPIFSNSEGDSPTSCVRCHYLIPHNLTSDGHCYIRDAINENIANGDGNYGVLFAWAEQYEPEMLEALIKAQPPMTVGERGVW